MVENEPMEFFDFTQAFSDLNSKIESMTSAMATLSEEFKKKKEYPYPYPKDKKMSEDESEPEPDKEKDDMAAKIKQYEDAEKKSLLDNLSELQENETVKTEFSEFSADQLKKLIDMSKSKTVNFGKTVKGKEDPSSDSKKIAELKARKETFINAGLETSADGVQKELDILTSR